MDGYTYAIRTVEGQHLGFLLMAGGPEAGDCIFRSLPFDSENFDIPESTHLYALQQQGEFQWRLSDAVFLVLDGEGVPIASIRKDRMTSSSLSYEVERLGKGH